MSVLVIDRLSIRVAGRPLLEQASLTLETGKRIGLLGRNGTGKSTLLKVIAGELAPDGGTVRIAARTRMAYVRQEAAASEKSLLDTVLEADRERADLLQAVETAPPERLAELHERLRTIEADAAPARAATILTGLGFDHPDQARPVSEFSGGWRMRVALAAALFAGGDLLLLDEPTNHLDLEAALWLENWLAKYPGAALIVSHDRGLLNRCMDGIAHLHSSKIVMFPGGYDEFVRIRTERALQQSRAAEQVAYQRERMQAFVDRFRAKATKARQAQARLKAIEKLPVIETAMEDAPTHFEFPDPAQLAPPLLTLEKVSVGYDGKPVLRGITATIAPDDRIALLGANGNGKSTFAKLLAGKLAPIDGKVIHSSRMKIGYYAQHQVEALHGDQSPLWHLTQAHPQGTPSKLRAQLARFGLDEEKVETPVSSLSGGEKARLLLALSTREAPHLLILDEPTNHLDIDAREALMRAISAYRGAVLLITHDSHLVELVADRLWVIGNGGLTDYEGDLDDYRATLTERATPATETRATASRRDDRRDRAEARLALAPLRKKAKDAEAKIAKLAQQHALLEAQLADPALYAPGRGADITALNSRIAAIGRETADLEAIWLEAEAALEAAAEGG